MHINKPWLPLHTKISYRWGIDLTIKDKSIKLLGSNIGEYLHGLLIFINKDFLNRVQKALTIKEKINKLDYI